MPTLRGLTPLRWLRGFLLARDKVLFRGHPIAAVCAADPHVAEDALDLIEVEYEVLPPVLDVQEAMSDAAPILHDDLRTEELIPAAYNAGGGEARRRALERREAPRDVDRRRRGGLRRGRRDRRG